MCLQAGFEGWNEIINLHMSWCLPNAVIDTGKREPGGWVGGGGSVGATPLHTHTWKMWGAAHPTLMRTIGGGLYETLGVEKHIFLSHPYQLMEYRLRTSDTVFRDPPWLFQ